jgi:sigma-B regulation protein RsbU (phosphoserine phosphatase)
MGYNVASVYQPALKEAEVGGDFYDVFEIDDNRIGILIGDIAGKGLQAAIGVASARYAVRSYAHLEPSPAKVLTYANNSLCKNSSDKVTLLTAFFAVLNVTEGTFTYSNAGHEYPYICRREGAIEALDDACGCALGILPRFEFSEKARNLQNGDRVVLITGGITEARTTVDNLFCAEGIVRYLSHREYDSTMELAHGLLKAATDHAKGELQDDAAVVVIGR